MDDKKLAELSVINKDAVSLAFMDIAPAGLKCIPVLGTKSKEQKVGRRKKMVDTPYLFYHMFDANDECLYEKAKLFIQSLKEGEKLMLTLDILKEKIEELGKHDFMVLFRDGVYENHPLDAIIKLHGNPIMVEVKTVY